MAAATIVHDTSEAVELCSAIGLHLKPITKMTISVSLPQLKQPGKSISNWEVMERLKAMVQNHQFSTLRISKSTMDFIRFEGEVEKKCLVKAFLSALDGKTIKLSGFSDILKVRAAEYKVDFPTRHDWDCFFRDAKDMNETLPGERPDTIHLQGLPCKWFASKDSISEKPSDQVLIQVFQTFGEIRNVDIPMLDPYREEMTGRNFHTFSFGGHLNFEAYIQYKQYAGFIKAMNALRGMKLMYKGDDGKAVACNIKVSFDSTKHLSDAVIKKRQLERQKLQELEQQREEQKRKAKEEEERLKEEERKQKEEQELERERKREEKLRRKEKKLRDREARRNQKRLEKMQAEEQRKLQEKIILEERKLLLAQRNLESIRLIAELLGRAKTVKLLEQEQKEAEHIRIQELEARRRKQEAELRRVEEEKRRTLGLQRKEKELREKLLNNLQKKQKLLSEIGEDTSPECSPVKIGMHLPVAESSSYVTSTSVQAPPCLLNVTSSHNTTDVKGLNGIIQKDNSAKSIQQSYSKNESSSQERPIAGYSTNPDCDHWRTKTSSSEQNACKKDFSQRGRLDTEESSEDGHKKHRSKHKRDLGSGDESHRKVKKHKKHSNKERSPGRRSLSPCRTLHTRPFSSESKNDKWEKNHSRKKRSHQKCREGSPPHR
ncbi:A-kinase anchor protein 17A [Ambystoma mexicanum]|uniref:A-kinase anchor protein 17A n=1 Tax=Ambystoma mexicanum TaxID=8296 RepID=UPI0037E8E17E